MIEVSIYEQACNEEGQKYRPVFYSFLHISINLYLIYGETARGDLTTRRLLIPDQSYPRDLQNVVCLPCFLP
jgi:hypothetical protein